MEVERGVDMIYILREKGVLMCLGVLSRPECKKATHEGWLCLLSNMSARLMATEANYTNNIPLRDLICEAMDGRREECSQGLLL